MFMFLTYILWCEPCRCRVLCGWHRDNNYKFYCTLKAIKLKRCISRQGLRGAKRAIYSYTMCRRPYDVMLRCIRTWSLFLAHIPVKHEIYIYIKSCLLLFLILLFLAESYLCRHMHMRLEEEYIAMLTNGICTYGCESTQLELCKSLYMADCCCIYVQ